jgi:hypothetical protein
MNGLWYIPGPVHGRTLSFAASHVNVLEQMAVRAIGSKNAMTMNAVTD